MENSYGIGTRNRYALFLDDESDPLELLKEKEQEKEQKKKNKASEKENKIKTDAPTKVKTVQGSKKTNKETPAHKPQDSKREDTKPNPRSNIESKPERNFNKFNNENREERNNRRNREDRQFNGPVDGNRDRDDRPPRKDLSDNFEGRPRNRNVGNKDGPRGPRNNRNFERRGKREFDRQSGSDKTGVKPIEKRDGAGAHNWGSHKDIIEEVNKAEEIDASWGDVDKNDSGLSAGENKDSGEPEPEAAPEVEEPKELTLDEWKAQREAQRAGRTKPQYNIRKAGEGEDPTQWKKMYELKKKEEETEVRLYLHFSLLLYYLNNFNDTNGPRGPRNNRNFERRGKREFDRQSGSDKTGVKPIEKRDGAGAHNWGSHKDIIEEVNKAEEIDASWGDVDKNDSGLSAGENKDSGEPEPEAAPEVEEPKELTLDEWKAQREAQRAGRTKPQYNIRKAGEGEDPTQWKKMYELKKKEEETEESEEEEYDQNEYPQRVGRQKHILDIDIHFNDSRRGGTGGRGRGGRAGRGARSNRDRQQPQQRFRGGPGAGAGGVANEDHDDSSQRAERAPKVDDERDFPSLS
ncbi:plasminogen activator inhibitor 1 RNA-binding protein-like [Agrilus planipennis]|uniref:Plasminogen activator inhibitor 1 RNA-binding protein-like n=1 Tax=Agrilus planipennis TaxID=224129 RepID=A0A7F5RE16_AGRPL|nr:plasminogen activator inhibitor 1 RNA-binding protein-like [Agrilus planipennis]